MKALTVIACFLTVVSSAVAADRRPVVAIADYMETNGVVSAKRGMTEALREAGFLPVVLPETDRAGVQELLSRCDAVMIGGGIRGQDYSRRCAFEDVVISLAAERNLPIVGICHGAQVINRHFGGTLGKVPSNGPVVHKDAVRFERTGERAEHDTTVLPGDSLMARVFGTGTVRINSSHTMRCLKLADGFKLTAQAADGVVEAYEHVSRPIHGFQFHPEFYWQKDRRCLELLRQSLSPPARHQAKPSFPSTGLNADFQVKYPEPVAERPPLRGVMLPPEKVTEKHFQTLKEWGVTLARYQMMPTGPDAWLVTTNCARYVSWLDAKLDALANEVLPLANRYGIRLVIDIHVPPGGRDGQIMHMCDRQDYLDCFVECWRHIAICLKGRPGIYGYDLINEPDQKREAKIADYWEVQRRAADVVRAIDPDTTILIASNGWNKPDNFAYLSPLAMDNVIYQVHVYQPMAFTHQGVLPKYKDDVTRWPDGSKGWNKDWLRKLLGPVREFQQRHHAKIYAGEFSAVSWAEGADRYLADLISLFEEYGWDWTYHAFREWPGWDAEKVCVGNARQPDKAKFKKDSDNPRLRVLRDAFAGRTNAVTVIGQTAVR